MSPHSPDMPKSPNVVPWHRPSGRHIEAPLAGRPRLRAGLALLTCLMATLALAAWAIPPLLDWSRFRNAIASIAASQLGRPVTLGGEVTLRLLPEAVLTAASVTLPDQGDGVSARIGSLRLQVALLPLLAGHIVPRDLVLGSAVLRLPWPLSEKLAHPGRPRVPHAFAAHVENGTLRIGQAEVTGINAGLHGAPEPSASLGTTSPPEPVAPGFGAEGFAAFDGRTWRFTSALGAPDADGVSAVDLALSGQGDAGPTGAQLQGTLADGVIQGRLVAGGQDLSQLMPAAPLAWHAEAAFVADGDRIESKAIGLSLGGVSAEASLTLRLAKPARLDVRVHAPLLNLDSSGRRLASSLVESLASGFGVPRLPGRIDWAADTVQVLGGLAHDVQGTLVSDGISVRLENGVGVLPGTARLTASGKVSSGADGLLLTGPARLDAPDLHATLAWLRPLAPPLVDAIPTAVLAHAVLAHAVLAGTLSVGPDSLSVSGLSGNVDGAGVAGGFGVRAGPHPHLGIGLTLDRLRLEDWFGINPSWSAAVPARLGRRLSQVDSDVHLRTAEARWRGVQLHDLVLDMRTGDGGVSVDHAAMRIAGATLAGSFTLSADGVLSGGRLTAGTPDLSAMTPLLPLSMGWLSGLWQGAGVLETSFSGAPDALGVELRAEAGDLVLEADWRGDMLARTAAGTVTLRHPGTPRLLASLGVAGADQWLDTGSLAFRGQFAARPGQVALSAFDLAAADLRLAGHVVVDYDRAEPLLQGDIDAEQLALPALRPQTLKLQQAWLRGWGAQLAVRAAGLAVGGRSVASQVSARLDVGGGAGVVQIASASTMGSSLAGQIAFDAGNPTPSWAFQGRLTNIDLADIKPGWPVELTGGRADVQADLQVGSLVPPAAGLSGRLHASIRGATLAGLDLGRVAEALTLRGAPGRAALRSALSEGQTSGLSGTGDLDLAERRGTLSPMALTSADGAVSLSGWADRTGNIDVTVAPAGLARPEIGVRLSGTWAAPHVALNLGAIVPLRHVRKHR